jgi:hypothetical protein
MRFWLVLNEKRHTKDREVTISKIGRKWVTLSDGNRFDRTSENWRNVDGAGYSSPGRLWDSTEQYEEYSLVRQIIDAIQRRFRFGRDSENVSLENARQAARLLGLEVV